MPIKDLPHAEERPQGASRSTHYLTTAGLANLLTASKAGIQEPKSPEVAPCFLTGAGLGPRFRGGDE